MSTALAVVRKQAPRSTPKQFGSEALTGNCNVALPLPPREDREYRKSLVAWFIERELALLKEAGAMDGSWLGRCSEDEAKETIANFLAECHGTVMLTALGKIRQPRV